MATLSSLVYTNAQLANVTNLQASSAASFAKANAALANTSGISTAGNLIVPGVLTSNIGGGGLALRAGATSNHVYIEYWPRSVQSARGAYVGYASAATNTFSIINETTTGLLQFGTNSAVDVSIDATGNLLVGRTTSTIGLGVKLDVSGSINAESTISRTFFNPNLDAAAFGYQALFNNTNVYNAAFGAYALFTNTSGYGNAGFGQSALYTNLSGINNTGIGYQALYWNSIGEDNTSVGANSLLQNRGYRNIAIGSNAGSLIRFGSNNVIVGAYAGDTAPVSGNGNNWIVLADGGGTIRLVADANGNFGLARNPGTQRLSIAGANLSMGVILNNSVTGNNVGFIGNYSTWLGTGADDNFVVSSYGSRSVILSTNATERMRIDGSGRMTLPYQPGFLAIGAGFSNTVFSNRNVGNFVSGTTGHNVGNHYSPAGSSGTNRFTAPVAGYYLMSAGVLYYGGTNTNPAQISLRLNGSTVLTNYRDGATQNQSLTISAFLYLAQNDWVDAYAESATANQFYDNGATTGQYGTSSYNYFSGRLVG